MAPKRTRRASSTAESSKAKRSRCQANRREIEDKVERFMKTKVYGNLAMSKTTNVKVDGKLLEERLRELYEEGDVKRLGARFAAGLLASYGLRETKFDDVQLTTSDKNLISDELPIDV